MLARRLLRDALDGGGDLIEPPLHTVDLGAQSANFGRESLDGPFEPDGYAREHGDVVTLPGLLFDDPLKLSGNEVQIDLFHGRHSTRSATRCESERRCTEVRP